MFAGATLAIELKFAEDDVFGRSDVDFDLVAPAQTAAKGKGPQVQGVGADAVDVGFVAAVVVDDVEVSALGPGLLGADHRFRRDVKFGLGKSVEKRGTGGVVEREDGGRW